MTKKHELSITTSITLLEAMSGMMEQQLGELSSVLFKMECNQRTMADIRDRVEALKKKQSPTPPAEGKET